MPASDVIDPSQVQWDAAAAPDVSAPINPAKVQWDDSPTQTVGGAANAFAGGVNAGVADIAGLPVDTMRRVTELTKAGVGSAYGALTSKDVLPSGETLTPDGTATRTTHGLYHYIDPKTGADTFSKTPPPPGSKPYTISQVNIPAFLQPTPDADDFGGSASIKRGLESIAGPGITAPVEQTPLNRILHAGGEALPYTLATPEAPIAGAASNFLGGASSQAAAELGGGPTAQSIAGLAGGSLPALGTALAGGTRLALRGGEAGQQAMQDRLADAEASGTSLSAGQASGSKLLQMIEGASSKFWGGGPLRQLAEEQTADVGSRVSDIVDNLSQGTAVSPTVAGTAIESGINATTEGMRAAEKAAQAKVDSLVDPNTLVTVSGPVAENHLNAQKQTLENLVQGVVNSAGEGSTPTGAGQTISAGVDAAIQNMRSAEKAAYSKVDEVVPPESPIPISSTLATLTDLSTPVPGAERTTSALVPKAITTLKSNIEADIAAAQKQPASPAGKIVGVSGEPLIPAEAAPPVDLSSGTLPYSALTATRTKLGNSIDWGYSPADPVTNAALKRVYGALTEDLNNGAAAVGPEAADAVKAARSLYATNAAKRELLTSVIDRAGGPEAVFSAATSGLKGGATKLSAVMQALDPDGQNIVRSTILQRMGNVNGAFDSEALLKNWSNLAPESKAAIVSDPAMRQALDTAAATHADLRAQLQNGTAQVPYGRLIQERENLGSQAEAADASPSVRRAHQTLTREMNEAASASNPKANAALQEAQQLTDANQRQRELLDSVIGKAGGPEAIFQAATNGTKQGATKISQVMGALAPDQQNIVRATVLDRMGRAVPSAQNAVGDAFSINTLLTNWSKLSPEAKDALFGTQGNAGTLRTSLDQLTRTASTIRNSTLLKNPSGSGEAVGHGAGLFALLEGAGAAIMGHPGHLAAVGSAIAANNVLARALTNPRTAQWLARSTRLPMGSLPNAINQLSRIGQQNGDPDATDLATLLQNSMESQDASIQRASGGRVDHEALVTRLYTRWKKAQRDADETTKPLLKFPDETISRALKIAQSHPIT